MVVLWLSLSPTGSELPHVLYPMLENELIISQYIGQAAYISQNKDAFSNPFFNSVPPGMFYPSLVVAILAAIVASQTMITATFQVTVNLHTRNIEITKYQ